VDQTVCPPSGCTDGLVAGLKVAVIAGRVAVTNLAGTVEVPAGATLALADAQARPGSVLPTTVSPGRPSSGRVRPADAPKAGPSAPSPGMAPLELQPIEQGRFGER
jgi:hypothetical protein